MNTPAKNNKQNVDNLLTVVSTFAVSPIVLDYAYNHSNIVVSFAVGIPMVYLLVRALKITLQQFQIIK